ncbi:ECF transporter S component [Halobacillus litoralis]|nr:ECF transporter S component [Halobacillus litoralis]MYL38832.1 ECF transporter S component [Halobacillus litoralis]
MSGTAVLASISIVLYSLKFPLPFFPVFLTMDFSDIPALIGAMVFGTGAGIIIQLLKNTVDYLLHGSYAGLPAGRTANFLSGSLLVGLVFFQKKKKVDPLSLTVSILLFLCCMYGLHYYFILPAVMNLIGVSASAYVQGFTAFQPLVHDFRTAVAFVIRPFNFIKICTVYALGIPRALKLFRLVGSREPGR